MYRPEKPAPTTTASNCSGTEAGLFTRRSLEVPELGKGGFDGAGGRCHPGACWALQLTLTQLHKCANACRSDSLWRAPRSQTPPAKIRWAERDEAACGAIGWRAGSPLQERQLPGPGDCLAAV